jgi:protoporphyrinogen oxidase
MLLQQITGRIGIIGAGPAGLTAAYLLSGAGLSVDVWEADPTTVGGISRTVTYKGFRFDIGGHRFFSKSQEVEDLWTEILPDDMLVRERLSRIFYRNKFYAYPLDAAEVILNLGKRESLLSVASYAKAKLSIAGKPSNLEEWMTRKFGGRLYQMFFKSYTEKVWGVPCNEISADWAAQRIKGLSLSKVARNALLPRRQSAAEANGGDRSKVIKTLITSFRYPQLGPGMMWEAAAEKVHERGGFVHLGTKVSGIRHVPDGGWELTVTKAGESDLVKTYDQVISTAPLRWLVRTLVPALPTPALEAAAALRYRDFITVALIVRPTLSFPDNWLYIHDPHLMVGRIQNFANWSPEMVPDPALACYGMEYFCNETDQLWRTTDSELIALATRELEALHLVRHGDVLDGAVVRQPKAYPVYDDDYADRRAILRTALKEACPGLHTVGRNGMHQYNNQDHSMMTAILTARNILAGQELYDVWNVNQDAEYIEEETGKG